MINVLFIVALQNDYDYYYAYIYFIGYAVGIILITDPAKLKTSVTLEDIYMERRFEFAWEALTRQDQIRFGTYLDPIPGWRGALPSTRLLMPIPQTARDANPNLQQNPGYN